MLAIYSALLRFVLNVSGLGRVSISLLSRLDRVLVLVAAVLITTLLGQLAELIQIRLERSYW